jgi:glycosyltransferase involved in cell wall biosynthesis
VTKTSESGERLAIVLSHPTQYYSPWFRWLRAHTPVEFRVFYLWDFGVSERHDPNFGKGIEWDVDLLSGYDSEFVPNASRRPGADHFFGFNNPGLSARLAAWRPTALLLFGYKWASHIRVIAWALRNRVPIIFRGDSHLIGRASPPLISRVLLGGLYSRFSGFLHVGAANREYFEAFGVPDTRLFFAPHSVDAALYRSAKGEYREAAAMLRSQLGADPATRIVLFAGKLIAAKQPMELLEAFLDLNAPETLLVFVGEGREKERLQAFASQRQRKPGGMPVRFLPFANQSEMPSRYLIADIFALPSRGLYETWGLAVNEAMHMGIPCLVSSRVGCQRDLVTHGETGWVFDPEDPRALGRCLSGAIADLGSEARRAKIRQGVERRIAGYTYSQTTDGLLAALASLRR